VNHQGGRSQTQQEWPQPKRSVSARKHAKKLRLRPAGSSAASKLKTVRTPIAFRAGTAVAWPREQPEQTKADAELADIAPTSRVSGTSKRTAQRFQASATRFANCRAIAVTSPRARQLPPATRCRRRRYIESLNRRPRCQTCPPCAGTRIDSAKQPARKSPHHRSKPRKLRPRRPGLWFSAVNQAHDLQRFRAPESKLFMTALGSARCRRVALHRPIQNASDIPSHRRAAVPTRRSFVGKRNRFTLTHEGVSLSAKLPNCETFAYSGFRGVCSRPRLRLHF